MKRSLLQNKSLHKYCTDLATEMANAGFDQRVVIDQFKEGFMVPWTMDAVKNIFRAVASAMYDVKSTAELDTVQIQRVYRAVDMRISEITGIRVEWPSEQSMRENENNNV